MKRLHIHSDNPTWAGSENMPGIFLTHPIIQESFETTFSYRYSKEYIRGMKKWLGLTHPLDALFPPYFGQNLPITWVNQRPKPFQILRYFPLMKLEIRRFRNLLRILKPDRVHINNGGYPGAMSCNSMAIAAKAEGIPMITYMINSTFRDLWWERAIGLSYKMIDSVDYWCTASHDLATKTKFLHDMTRVRVIPNTVRRMKRRSPHSIRSELGMSEDEVLFAGVGIDAPRKGWHVLERAFCRFPYRLREKARLVIQCRSEHNFDTHSLIDACDVLVVPSLSDEDFPNVILIAFMYGKPVIASAIAGIPEQLAHGGGVAVYPGGVETLLDAMDMLMSRELRVEYGINAEISYNYNYSPEVVLNKWKNLWEGRETWDCGVKEKCQPYQ